MSRCSKLIAPKERVVGPREQPGPAIDILSWVWGCRWNIWLVADQSEAQVTTRADDDWHLKRRAVLGLVELSPLPMDADSNWEDSDRIKLNSQTPC